MKFYHYVHCPFCVRIRLVYGLLDLEYESIVLPYDDEETPKALMGVKMLPILVDGEFKTNESLVIIKHLDRANSLKLRDYEGSKSFKEVEQFLAELGNDVHSLAMPYWMYTKEFDENSRKYFQKKKEVKRGPFNELVKNRNKFSSNLDLTLSKLDTQLKPFYQSSEISIYDIMIASHLWGMYVVPEYRFSDIVHNYLQLVSQKCNFNYHQDFWR